VNAKTTSDLRSYCAPVVSDERESRTGHVVNCTAQVELHQIYFNIKPESPGDTRLRAPFWPLLSIREVSTRAVSVVLQCWIFWCGGVARRRGGLPPHLNRAFPSVSQLLRFGVFRHWYTTLFIELNCLIITDPFSYSKHGTYCVLPY